MDTPRNGFGGGMEQRDEAGDEFNAPTMEKLNMRCTGVKRLLKEAMELRHPNEMFCAKPMEDNLFEWHFTVRGPPDSSYSEGVYHGRIVLPADYPMKPPNLILLTPNGRFETNKKICLSISGYHPETWLPSWSIRTALLALIGFMPTHSAGALGGLECSREERRRLAIKSLDWCCGVCGVTMRDVLPALGSTERTEHLLEEVRGAASSNCSTSKNANKKNSSSEKTTTSTSNENNASASEETINNATSNPSPTNIIGTAASPSHFFHFLVESPLFWIVLLTAFLIALLFRRTLIATSSDAYFDPTNIL